jgi:hypothetical protein
MFRNFAFSILHSALCIGACIERQRRYFFSNTNYPVAWAMVGDIFGPKHFAKIRGYMTRGDS